MIILKKLISCIIILLCINTPVLAIWSETYGVCSLFADHECCGCCTCPKVSDFNVGYGFSLRAGSINEPVLMTCASVSCGFTTLPSNMKYIFTDLNCDEDGGLAKCTIQCGTRHVIDVSETPGRAIASTSCEWGEGIDINVFNLEVSNETHPVFLGRVGVVER